MNSVWTVLDESSVAAALNLHPFDDEFVTPTPPLCDQLRIGERPPYTFEGR
jgi:hypothetical protein